MTQHNDNWTYEYMPYTITNTDGSESELPNYRIHPAGDDGDDVEKYIAETNEHLDGELQERHAILICTAPRLAKALEYFFNIMHDYESSLRKGYVKHAMEEARTVLAMAKGRAFL